jgi:hypothetical protein
MQARVDFFKKIASMQKQAGVMSAIVRGLWGAGKLYTKRVTWPIVRRFGSMAIGSAKQMVAPKTSLAGRVWGGLGVLFPAMAASQIVPPVATAPLWVPYNIAKSKYGQMPIPRVGAL